MANVLIDENFLVSMADKIRALERSSDSMFASEMASRIEALPLNEGIYAWKVLNGEIDTGWIEYRVSDDFSKYKPYGSNGYGYHFNMYLEPGLYDNTGILATWDELVNDYGLDLSIGMRPTAYDTTATSLYYVLNNNSNLSKATTLVIGPGINTINSYAAAHCDNLQYVVIPDTITTISSGAFTNNTALEVILIAGTPSINQYAFSNCYIYEIYVSWLEDAVVNAPWGANDPTIHYNYGSFINKKTT